MGRNSFASFKLSFMSNDYFVLRFSRLLDKIDFYGTITTFFFFVLWTKKVHYSMTPFCQSMARLRYGVLRGSVLTCLTCTPGVLDLRTGSSRFFVGMSWGKTLQSPCLVLVKPKKDTNNLSCRHDMTEILLKAA